MPARAGEHDRRRERAAPGIPGARRLQHDRLLRASSALELVANRQMRLHEVGLRGVERRLEPHHVREAVARIAARGAVADPDPLHLAVGAGDHRGDLVLGGLAAIGGGGRQGDQGGGDQAHGISARSVVPAPAVLVTATRPASAPPRSASPRSPEPAAPAPPRPLPRPGGSSPLRASATTITARPLPRVTRTLTAVARACLATLASASAAP